MIKIKLVGESRNRKRVSRTNEGAPAYRDTFNREKELHNAMGNRDFVNQNSTYAKRKTTGNYNLLQPTGNRKSYGGKAHITTLTGGRGEVLVSYDTPVCGYIIYGPGEPEVFEKYWDGYSSTTMRHINDFRLAHGDDKLSMAEWKALDVDSYDAPDEGFEDYD